MQGYFQEKIEREEKGREKEGRAKDAFKESADIFKVSNWKEEDIKKTESKERLHFISLFLPFLY